MAGWRPRSVTNNHQTARPTSASWAVIAFFTSFVLWSGLLVAGFDGVVGRATAAYPSGSYLGANGREVCVPGCSLRASWPGWLVVVLVLGGAVTVMLADLALRQRPVLFTGLIGPAVWLVALLATLAWRHTPFSATPQFSLAPTPWPTWGVLALSAGLVVAATASWSMLCQHLGPTSTGRTHRLAVPAFLGSVVTCIALLLSAADGAFGHFVVSGFNYSGYNTQPWWPTWVLALLLITGLATVLLGRLVARERAALVAGVVGPVCWVAAAVAALLWRTGTYTYVSHVDYGCVSGCPPERPPLTAYASWPLWVDIGLAVGLMAATGLGRWAWRHRG
jgi:hypothetical protein